MNTILLANFVDRLHSAQSLKADFGLELRTVKLPRLYLSHRFLILSVGYSLNYCPAFGVRYIAWQTKILKITYGLFVKRLPG